MSQSRKVLVVDDDAVVGHSINRVLTGQGYQVREAASGLRRSRSWVTSTTTWCSPTSGCPGWTGWTWPRG